MTDPTTHLPTIQTTPTPTTPTKQSSIGIPNDSASNTTTPPLSNRSTSSQRFTSTPNTLAYPSLTPNSRKRNRKRIGEMVHPLSPAALRHASTKPHFDSNNNFMDRTTPTPASNHTSTNSADNSSNNSSNNSSIPFQIYRPNSFHNAIVRLSNACQKQYINSAATGTTTAPIAFIGPGGIGKTVVLRAWLKKFQQDNKESSVNLVTIGETLESRDYLSAVHALGQSLVLSVAKAATATLWTPLAGITKQMKAPGS